MLISEALEGKFVRSFNSRREGIIQYADIRKDIATPEGCYAYAVNVRPIWDGTGYPKPDFWTTIYIGEDN